MFDEKKLAFNVGNADYYIDYYILHSKRQAHKINSLSSISKKLKNGDNYSKSCFASLGKMCNDFEKGHKVKPNKVFYKCNLKYDGDHKLSLEEVRAWLDLCQENYLLPEGINSKAYENGSTCIDMENISSPRLYIYLCIIRHMQEYPHFVRAVLHMVHDIGMGVFTSLAVANRLCVCSSLHTFLPPAGAYGMNFKKAEALKKYQFDDVAKLYKFLTNEEKYTFNTDVLKFMHVLNNMKQEPISIKREDLTDPATERIIRGI